MKNIYLPVIVSMLALSEAVAQRAVDFPIPPRCGTYEYEQYLHSHNPKAPTQMQFESWLGQKIVAMRNARPSGVLAAYQLPVVFHIIHNGEVKGTGRNTDSALITSQMMQLNKDYANRSGSTYAVAVNTELQFCLAQKNPAGAALVEPGVDRVNRNDIGVPAPPWTYGFIDSTIKKKTIWDPKKYVNVWVVDMQGSLLGISTFPGMSGLAGLFNNETDTTAGATIRYTTVGSSLNPNPAVAGCDASFSGYGRTLSHELGHYFGLRHIWGDADCGNDFCGDTPTHFGSNSGKPTHPKANSCGTADEMFENYMDYSDDDIVNTFTDDQKIRMQVVMLNSPRRLELAASTVGCGPALTSKKVAFVSCTPLVVKEGSAITPCERFKDYSFAMIVEDKASGPATVNFNTGGSATNGRDFRIIPSPLNFVAGESYKPFVIRVYDDAFEELGNDNLFLSYSIAGTGLEAGTINQSLAIFIQDDDVMQVGTKPDTLVKEDFGTAGTPPANFNTFQFSGINHWAFGTNGGTPGASAYITKEAVANPANKYDTSSVSGSILYVPSVTGAYTRKHKLSFDWRCAGESVGGTNFDFGFLRTGPINDPRKSSYIPGSPVFLGNDGAALPYSLNLPVSLSNTNFSIGWSWVNDLVGGNDPGFTVDNVLLTGERAKVETQAVNGSSQIVRGSETTVFYSASDSDIVCKVSNIFPFTDSIGCVTANVSEAGNGRARLTFSPDFGTDSSFRSQKVFTIVPNSPNTTAGYTPQLYFTFDEVNIWGDEKYNLKVMKVKDGAPLNGPFNTSNAVVLPGFNSSDTSQNWISYAAQFFGSFSGYSRYVLVSPNTFLPFVPLPVTFLEFGAVAMSNNVQLNWKVTNMQNVSGFIVEKSNDGRRFDSIAWLPAGDYSSTAIKNYYLKDSKVSAGNSYYYRIQQRALDYTSKFSEVRKVKLPHTKVEWLLVPNPATQQLTLILNESVKVKSISIVNTAGQVVKNVARTSRVNGRIELDISNLAAGVYQLQLFTGNDRLVKTFLKQ